MPKNTTGARRARSIDGRELPFRRLDLSTPLTDEEARRSDEWWHYSLGLRILAVLDGLDAIRERDLKNPAADSAGEAEEQDRSGLDIAGGRKKLSLYALVLYARRFGVSRWS